MALYRLLQLKTYVMSKRVIFTPILSKKSFELYFTNKSFIKELKQTQDYRASLLHLPSLCPV